MRSIVVGAGSLIALFDREDAHNQSAVAILRRADDSRLVTNSLVVGEVAAMLADVPPNLSPFLDWLLAAVEIDDVLREDLPRIKAIIDKYADRPAGVTDASPVAMCERRRIDEVALIDGDFAICRTAKGKRFESVFQQQE